MINRLFNRLPENFWTKKRYADQNVPITRGNAYNIPSLIPVVLFTDRMVANCPLLNL